MADAPGRSCPIHYRYAPERLCADPIPETADVLYVIGGLYGNPLALDAIEAMTRAETDRGRSVRLLFNGDFNWFNTDPATFEDLNGRVLAHPVVQGNVEYELGNPSPEAGCGCAYPDFVDDTVVQRSNRIMQRLQATANRFPAIQARLRESPRWRALSFHGQRLLILHGDPESLAGWGLAHENLRQPGHQAQVADWFSRTGADLIACTHTCLPAVWQRRSATGQPCTIINNGSAGMGNLKDDPRGLISRIAPAHLDSPVTPISRHDHGSLAVSLLPVTFSLADWLALFDRWWPAGTDAALSYRPRIMNGTSVAPEAIRL